MSASLFVWLQLSVSWLTPSVTTSIGPVVYGSAASYSLVAETNTISIEPATLSYEYVSREVEIESRVAAFILVPTR